MHLDSSNESLYDPLPMTAVCLYIPFSLLGVATSVIHPQSQFRFLQDLEQHFHS